MKKHLICTLALVVFSLFSCFAADDPSSSATSTAVVPPVTLRVANASDQRHAQNSVGLRPRAAYAKYPQLATPRGNDFYVTVKFLDRFRARSLPNGGLSLLGNAIPPGLADVVANEGLTFRPSFTLHENDLEAFENNGAVASGNAQPDFAGILAINITGRSKEEIMRNVRALYALDCVEFVSITELDKIAPPPGDIAPPTADFRDDQTWRQSAPGVDIDYGWSYVSQGQLTGVVDIEQALEEEHEDLVDIGVMELSAGPYAGDSNIPCNESHGAGTMGVLAAPDNGYGITGAAVKAEKVGFVSFNTTPSITQEEAIVRATSNLDPGDIILLEIQSGGILDVENGDFTGFGPAEIVEAVHMATKTATDALYIVVGAAGNGGEDLDRSPYNTWRSWGDSGAIIVGAGSADDDHWRLDFSTFGSRVDVQAWGENVLTTRTGSDRQLQPDGSVICIPPPNNVARLQTYSDFSGTSSASAVTAAVATALQSFSRQRYGSDLTPNTMRLLLEATGIPQTPGGPAGSIGPCVNVKNAIDAQLAAQLEPASFPTNNFSFPQAVPIFMYDEWVITEEAGGGSVEVSNSRLEITTSNNGRAEFAIADLHVDLDGIRSVALQFDYEKLDKQPFHGVDIASYTGIGEADGVFISNGSSTWHRIPILGLAEQTFEQGMVTHRVSLDAVATELGVTFNDDIRIRFQHFRPAGNNEDVGIAIDNVSVDKGGTNGELTFSSGADITLVEGNDLRLEVGREEGKKGDVSFEIALIAGTTSEGSDFPIGPFVSTIPNEVEGVEIEIDFPNDTQIECIEYLTVRIQSPSGGASLGRFIERTVFITDNDQVLGANESHFSRAASATIVAEDPGAFLTGPPPIPLNVTGISGNITSVTAKLVGLSHTSLTELDIFLESPTGTIVKLMSDTFPFYMHEVVEVDVTFSDGAAVLPLDPPLLSQAYRPWDQQGSTDNLLDGTSVGNGDLADFNGEDPTGLWRLHIVDDTANPLFAGLPGNGGSLQGGYELFITTAPAPNSEFRIVDIERTPEGLVRLSWNAELGRSYRVQVSTDLTEWFNFGGTLNGVDGVRTHGIMVGASSEEYFYRIIDVTP